MNIRTAPAPRRIAALLVVVTVALGIAGPFAGTASARPKDPGGVTVRPPAAPPTTVSTPPPDPGRPGADVVGGDGLALDPGVDEPGTTRPPAPEPPATQPPAPRPADPTVPPASRTGTDSGVRSGAATGAGALGATAGSAALVAGETVDLTTGTVDPTVSAEGGSGVLATALWVAAGLALVGALAAGGVLVARRRRA